MTTTLAEILIEMGAPDRGAPAALRWLAGWLPDADRRELSVADLGRINAWQGDPAELHTLLAAVLPLARPRWFETPVTAAGGTEMILGYGAVPTDEGAEAVDIGFACWAPGVQRVLAPLGPARVTMTGIERPADASDEVWRELRAAAGIALRAILLFPPRAPRLDAQRLREVGEALYGERWQTALAADLDISSREMRRWLAGSHHAPPAIAGELAALIDRHISRLDAARGLLGIGGKSGESA